MNVFLTGATGFIGSRVARLLVQEGHDVTALVRERSHRARLEGIESELRLVTGELGAVHELERALRQFRPELCIHAAWYAEPGSYLHAPENATLAAATLELAMATARAGCGRFVGIGTCYEYDTSIGVLSEDSPTRPASIYAAAKLAVATVLGHLPSVTGMATTWARLFLQFGPFEDERRLVPAVTRALLHGDPAEVTPGEQIRDFLHVDDVASAVYATARFPLDGVVNIGSGEAVRVKQLVEALGALTGRADCLRLGAIPYPPGEPMTVAADVAKLRSTGWFPRYSLVEGLAETVDWWRARSPR